MKEHRSLFWPLTLIGTGVIWLLISLNRIPASNLWALTHIWPYLLIALGVGLILRSLWRPLGMLVTALVVVGAALSVVFAPQLHWDNAPDWNIGAEITGNVPGSGILETENRLVSEFDSIDIRYPAQITIQQGNAESLTIEAEDNLLPQLSTDVSSGTLVIENREKNVSQRVLPTKPVKITITVKTLEEINFPSAGELTLNGLKSDSLTLNLSGAGDITMNDLDLGSLEARLSGAGQVTVQGKADTVDVSISGAGDFRGQDLTAQTANVRISGFGSIYVRVEENLTANVSGFGSVTYYGSPSVTKNISGAGSISKGGE